MTHLAPPTKWPRLAAAAAPSRVWLLVAYAVVSVAYIVVAMHQPIGVNAVARHDDTYFLSGAQSMIAGDWLGPYNQMTLIKGPGFTYFLALNHLVRAPITLALALALVAGCATLVATLGRVGLTHPVARLLLFIGLLFQPALIPVQIIRDSLYHSLFLFVFAGFIALAIDQRGRWCLLRVALGGGAVGVFWITREEGVWVLPALAVLVAAGVWQAWRSRQRGAFLLAAAVFAGVAAAPVFATAAINRHEYGTFAVQDFKSSGFQDAIRALDGISQAPEIRQVPITAQNLDAAYRVSPTLRSLEPFLESPDLAGWLSLSCAAVPDACGSYLGGILPWALRDAAAFAGAYQSPQTADAFYQRIATEIRAACEQGTLRCRSSPFPLVPVMTEQTVRHILPSIWAAIRVTMYDRGTGPTRPSIGTRTELSALSDFLGSPERVLSAEEGYTTSRDGWSRVKVGLEGLYRVASPVALILGLATFVVAAARRKRARSPMIIIATSAWVLYGSRIGLIALIDASSFPAINAQYLEPAFLALYIAAAASITGYWETRTKAADGDAEPVIDHPLQQKAGS